MSKVDLKTIRANFEFSMNELAALAISIFVTGLIIGFNDGSSEFFLPHWGLNFFNSLLIAALIILVPISVQKIVALVYGFKAHYKAVYYGLIIGLIITVVTNGKVWILIPSAVVVSHMIGLRLGEFRYGLNYKEQGIIALSGSIASIVLALLIRIISYIPGVSSIADKIIIASVLIGIFSMLPIPPLNGSHVFFYSRLVYAFIVGIVVGAGILILVAGPLWTILGGLLIGVLTWFVYLVGIENASYWN